MKDISFILRVKVESEKAVLKDFGFSSSHVRIWELDHKQGWELKNWCFWTVVLEKTLRVPWTAKRSNQSILKEINPEHSWEELMLKWSSNTLTTWCAELTHFPWCWERLKPEEKGMAEDDMVRWHHQLNGHESEQIPKTALKSKMY